MSCNYKQHCLSLLHKQRLQCDDLIFLERLYCTIKVNGKLVALKEIENTLRGHPDVVDAAVLSCEALGELLILETFLLLKKKLKSRDSLISSTTSWMVRKVPLTMISSRFVFTESLPMSSTGKVNYAKLEGSLIFYLNMQDVTDNRKASDFLQVIKKVDLVFMQKTYHMP